MTTEETKQDVAPQGDAADVTQSSDGIDWETIYKTPQFQSVVADYKKRTKAAEAALAARDAAQAAAEDAKLKEQGDHQKIAEKLAQELQDTKVLLEAATTGRQRDTKRWTVEKAAQQHDPAFVPEAIPILLRMVELDELPDDDTLPKAVQDAVKAFAKANPYMLQTTRSDPGSPPGRKPAGSPSDDKARQDFERMVRTNLVR